MSIEKSLIYIKNGDFLVHKLLVDQSVLIFHGDLTQKMWLVGGIPTPLKNDGLRQLGWWPSQLNGKSNQIPWFQTTRWRFHVEISHWKTSDPPQRRLAGRSETRAPSRAGATSEAPPVGNLSGWHGFWPAKRGGFESLPDGSFIAGKCWKHLIRMKNFNGT